MKKIFCLFAMVITLSCSTFAQEVKGMKQIFDITVDELGAAKVEVSMKLNAAQWDQFKRNIGSNTSIMKREIERSLPKYFLSDFNYSEDQMERTYKVSFKALGLATVNKNGKWESKLDTKDPDITKLTDHDFNMTSNMMSNGMLIQQTQKIHLPSSASDAKIEKDSFGKAVMTYSTGSGFAAKIPFIGGILLILAGIGLYFKTANDSKNKLRVVNKESMVA